MWVCIHLSYSECGGELASCEYAARRRECATLEEGIAWCRCAAWDELPESNTDLADREGRTPTSLPDLLDGLVGDSGYRWKVLRGPALPSLPASLFCSLPDDADILALEERTEELYDLSLRDARGREVRLVCLPESALRSP